MPPQDAPRRTLQDIERLERVPLARRLAVGSTYELLQKTMASSLEQPARCFLPLGDPSQPGEALTARAFLRKVHQSANLLADLGTGPQDVMALLLPDLLEKELLLWGGQAAGIVCPIPPCLPAPQVVDLLQAVKAMVLVAPSPSVDHELWQKTEQVRRQVKSIALVLQVRGLGKNERLRMPSMHSSRITRLTASTPGARSPPMISRSPSLSETRPAHLAWCL